MRAIGNMVRTRAAEVNRDTSGVISGMRRNRVIKGPDRYAQGQVREREGGHDRDHIDSSRGSQERYLTSGIMTRRDGSEMVKAWGN